jgi:flagellar hook capping protein FlgD
MLGVSPLPAIKEGPLHPPIRHRLRHRAWPGITLAIAVLLSLGCQGGTPLGPKGSSRSTGNKLGADPQPAPPGVTPAIAFALRQPGSITVRIYDAQGGLVRTVREDLWAGAGVIRWDGLTDAGIRVGSGFYTYRLEGPDGIRFDGRLIVVR